MKEIKGLKDSSYRRLPKYNSNYGMEFLKKIREKRGLTKIEMADTLGILRSTYYYYEDSAKGIDLSILCLILKRLKISWQEIGKLIEQEFSNKHEVETIQIIRRPRGRPRKSKID